MNGQKNDHVDRQDDPRMTQKRLWTGTWCQVPGLLFRTHRNCLQTAEWEVATIADVTNKGLDSETKDDMETEDDDFTEAEDAKNENTGQTESNYITYIVIYQSITSNCVLVYI